MDYQLNCLKKEIDSVNIESIKNNNDNDILNMFKNISEKIKDITNNKQVYTKERG
jgi:hypothetical protein